MCKVFISYRRDGGEYLTGRIYDYLTNHGISVFYDMESLHTGKFDDQLYKKIDECQYFIAVLPPNALDRCVSEDDWVRQEIARAIELKKTIIPILMPGFSFPKDLPEDISEIAAYQGFVVNNAIFKEQMNHLIETLTADKKKKLPKKLLISCISAAVIIVIAVGTVFLINNAEKELPQTKNQSQPVNPPAPPTPPEPEPIKYTHNIDTYIPAIGMKINDLKTHFDSFKSKVGTPLTELCYTAKTEKLDKELIFTFNTGRKICTSIEVPAIYLFPGLETDDSGNVEIAVIKDILGSEASEVNSSSASFTYDDYTIKISLKNSDFINYENSYCTIRKKNNDSKQYPGYLG